METRTARLTARWVQVPVEELEVGAYQVPTDGPEQDGTLCWDSTTLVVVHARSGDVRGVGYTYTHAAAADVIRMKLADLIRGRDAMAIEGSLEAMICAVRNMGRPGLVTMAISAVDFALWDLKARLLDLPLGRLLGGVRDEVPVYGSGGFTSYSKKQLVQQLSGWIAEGIPRVKLKVGRDPDEDLERVKAVRKAIGEGPEIYVDANGAYSRKQALGFAERFAEYGVTWFEEPVSSDDLEGLHLLRDQGPGGMAIAAGEYGWDAPYFRRMLEARAVDTLQVDGTRCGGLTGFLRAAALSHAFMVPVSAHTAPSMHLFPCLAAPSIQPLEYFHDHVRIEQMLFDGVGAAEGGCLRPDPTAVGNGLTFKRVDAERFRVK